MALTTVTTLTETVPAELIEAEALEEARPFNVVAPLVWNHIQPMGTGLVWNVPLLPTTTAASVEEASDISATARETTEGTLTISEVGLSTDLKDKAAEASVLNNQLLLWARSHGRAIAQLITSDLCDLFASLNDGTTIGTSGTAITVANFIECMYTLDSQNAPGQKYAVLHPRQVSDLFVAISASTGTPFSNLPELVREGRLPAGTPSAGFVGALFGVPVYSTTECPTANSAADRVGAMFVREALGFGQQRPLRTEYQRDASARVTEIVTTISYGVGEIQDNYGVSVTTDA